MKHTLLFCLTIAMLSSASAFAQDAWPKHIKGDNGSIISVYEPQPESISAGEVTGRAAVSFKKASSDEPVFGAILFRANVTDRRSSDVIIRSFEVTRAKFSGVEDENDISTLSTQIENGAQGWNWGLSMNDLNAAVEKEKGLSEEGKFNNAAPNIIYTDKPTSLVVLDGDPKILNDKDLGADKVANSPNLIFKDGNQWNLYAGGIWYKSGAIKNGWQVNNNLSSKVKTVNEAVKKQEKENRKDEEVAEPRVTDIIVVTEPTELLQTDGEPVYKAVSGTSLLYVSNSPNEIFKDINSQKTYILIAGRWFQSNSVNGPWKYTAADQLPEDFARIPDGSDKEAVLTNVAGTEAAEDAIINAAIPQTARVDRKTATIDVQYDGEPQFNPIEGTSLYLAENANLTVMMDNDRNYFALDNGIWFISDRPHGPWSVANDRPRDLERIPASSPAYNSRYVHIYDVTPDYVYMGYTSGYLGSYVYGPTIVYGTGYYYRPWFQRMYYPRPITWGFGFVYDPWYGWNFNWGYNPGFLYVGFNYGSWYGHGYGYGGGWFGPSRYCPMYRPHYWRGGNYYGYNRGSYYGRNYNNRNYYNRYYNVYNNQQGVTTRNINRTARITRPSINDRVNSGTVRPANDRYRNRFSNAERPSVSDRPTINNRNNSTISRPNNNGRLERNNDSRNPVINNPNRNNSGENSPNVRPQRSGEPVITAPQRAQRRIENPPVDRPQSNTPAEPAVRPNLNRSRPEGNRPELNRPNAPATSPQINRSSTPAVREDRSSRPAFNRSSTPATRPEYNRPSPAPRANVERSQAPASRPEVRRPSGGGSQGGSPRVSGPDRGRRIER